jgi:hypothetical protein
MLYKLLNTDRLMYNRQKKKDYHWINANRVSRRRHWIRNRDSILLF